MMAVSSSASAISFDTKITQILLSNDSATAFIYVDSSIDLDVLAAAAAGEGTTCHDHANVYTKESSPHIWAEWGNYVSFNTTRFMGQEYLSLLSMAFAANKTVTLVTGPVTAEAGGCADQSMTLTLNYFKVKY